MPEKQVCSSAPVSRRRAACAATACLLLLCLLNAASGQQRGKQQSAETANSSASTRAARGAADAAILRIVRAEDERRWDADLAALLFDKSLIVRRRAALAAGRIGDERSLASLLTLLQTDKEMSVRAMAAFALGEVESVVGVDSLIAASRKSESGEVRARSIEALGKIAAALPKTEEERSRNLGEAILAALAAEEARAASADKEVLLAGLTAILRARPTGAGATLSRFLSHTDARLRADAANALARLRSKDANEKLRSLLTADTDAVVRANAARALGAAEDKDAFDALTSRVSSDADERVRVSAIRALGALKDTRAAEPLLARGNALMASYRAARQKGQARPAELNELLEVASALGRALANTWHTGAVKWLRDFRETEELIDPEIEIAFARIAPALYVREKPFDRLADSAVRASLMKDWKRVSSIAQGLGEISGITAQAAGNSVVGIQADAQMILRTLLEDKDLPPLAAPDILRALGAYKSNDLAEVLRKQLKAKDVILRATAAELLGELPPEEANARALAEALPVAMRDQLNDAALSVLDALGKQKSASANESAKAALGSLDHLVRRRAAAALKASGAGDFSSQAGTVATRNTAADYQRALARRNGRVRATVTTDKGAFVIELLPDDAPLTVDNFVQLASQGFFNNITFHRVVPNFVVQGGDPRGDGNGGPGRQIRCEINEAPYETGAVGMALSGKDTGGSQWFVTHSPQPHLDGGYTVFGRVTSGMDVVDKLARGDVIRNVTVTEGARPASKAEKAAAR
jgi:cyclophilin family peptidyl-prolyl cis-trans isomerase/HEAT repeat protein